MRRRCELERASVRCLRGSPRLWSSGSFSQRAASPRRGPAQETRVMGFVEFFVVAAMALGGVALLFFLLGMRFIPNDRVGIVEKRWSAAGSLSYGLIALN